VRYALWNVIGVAPRLLSPAWRSRATEEQERIGWEMAVRIERIIATVHDEAHKQRVEEVMETLGYAPARWRLYALGVP
jgi:hypothetical protein